MHFETQIQQRRPHTIAYLKTRLQEEWDKITPKTSLGATLQSGKCYKVVILNNYMKS